MTPDKGSNLSIETAAGSIARNELGVEASRVSSYLSTRALLVLVFLILIFTLAARQVADPDFWWHLKTGQFICETRSIPHTDIFSTGFAGKEWITHEWLSEVFIYLVYRAAGFGGLMVTFALLISAACAVAYRQCAKRAGHPYVAGGALVLGALAAAPTWGVRPQIFTFLLASVFLSLLYDFREDPKRRSIWWSIPLMALWVNLHAGFAVGLALILLTMVGMVLEQLLTPDRSIRFQWQQLRTLGLVLLACVAAVTLNPNGLRLYSYPFETLTSRAMMRYIEEWHSPDFHEPMFLPLAFLFLAVFASLALSRKRIGVGSLVLLLATGFGALRSGRNVSFFVLVAMPLLAEHSWDWLTAQRWGKWLTLPEKSEAAGKAVLKVVLNVLLLICAPLAIASMRVQRNVATQVSNESQQYPAAAVDFLRTHQLPQPLYNEYGWGGYLIWKLSPEYRVHIDGRADVYGDAFMEEFLNTHDGGVGWQESLDKHRVRTVMIKPDCALASLLRQDHSWQKAFEDNQSVIFVKQ
jgi:hypothetical protein